jgi:hypothetical protein
MFHGLRRKIYRKIISIMDKHSESLFCPQLFPMCMGNFSNQIPEFIAWVDCGVVDFLNAVDESFACSGGVVCPFAH